MKRPSNATNGNTGQKTKVNKVKIIPVKPDGSFGIPGISLGGQQNEKLPSRPKGIGIAAVNNLSSGTTTTEPPKQVVKRQIPTAPKVKETIPEPKPKKVARIQPERSLVNDNIATDALGGDYAVQVAARRNETDALIAFANMQQKYPSIINQYRPLIQKADLSAQGKGVWYRLRIGPMNSKEAASRVCSQLKAQGIKGCFIKKL